jgi:hypothetical protein
MARGVPIASDTRAAALAALLTGQSVSQVARDFRVSPATIRGWRKSAGIDSSPVVRSQKREDIGVLVVHYVNEALHTLAVQAEFARDKTWLAKQPASEVAVLHGVIADKVTRILEALTAGDEEADI